MTDTTTKNTVVTTTGPGVAGPVLTRAQALAKLTAVGAPYELRQRELYARPIRSFANAPANLGELYATARSDATFLVYDDERMTFEETWVKAARLAQVLTADYGVRHGDRVAISMRNYPEWVIAFMAITSIGCVAVAMNSLWQPEEMAYGLTDSGSRVLLADPERLQRFAQYEADSGTQLPCSLIGVRLDDSVPASLTGRIGDFDTLVNARKSRSHFF